MRLLLPSPQARLSPRILRCGGPPQFALIDLLSSVDLTEAGNLATVEHSDLDYLHASRHSRARSPAAFASVPHLEVSSLQLPGHPSKWAERSQIHRCLPGERVRD